MTSSGLMVALPSGRLLQYYKNSLHQQPGFNEHIFQWMNEVANEYQIPSHGLSGSIIFDVMSIQSDLQLLHIEGEVKIIGFVDMGSECDAMQVLKKGKNLIVKKFM